MNTIITETTEQGEVPFDVYQKLASNRILFINSPINDKLASDLIATLMCLDADPKHEKISLFVNSGGGDIISVLMLYDALQLLVSPIETICTGNCFDESTIILCSGTPGLRIATKNCQISVSPLMASHMSMGTLMDAEKMVDLHQRYHKTMMEIIAKNSGKKLKQVLTDFDRRVFFTPEKALEYGLIDYVVNPNKKGKYGKKSSSRK